MLWELKCEFDAKPANLRVTWGSPVGVEVELSIEVDLSDMQAYLRCKTSFRGNEVAEFARALSEAYGRLEGKAELLNFDDSSSITVRVIDAKRGTIGFWIRHSLACFNRPTIDFERGLEVKIGPLTCDQTYVRPLVEQLTNYVADPRLDVSSPWDAAR